MEVGVDERILHAGALLRRQGIRHLQHPCQEAAGATLQYGQRQQEFLRLECKVLMRLDPFRRGADVEDRLLEVEPVDKLAQVQIIPMLSDTVERLVQRREALLIIEN